MHRKSLSLHPSIHPPIKKVLWQHLYQNMLGCQEDVFFVLFFLPVLYPPPKLGSIPNHDLMHWFCFRSAFVQVGIESFVPSWNVSLSIAAVHIRGVCWLPVTSVMFYFDAIILMKYYIAEVKLFFFKSIYISSSEFKMYSVSVHTFNNEKFNWQLTNSKKKRILNWNRKILWECPCKYHEVCGTQPQSWRLCKL